MSDQSLLLWISGAILTVTGLSGLLLPIVPGFQHYIFEDDMQTILQNFSRLAIDRTSSVAGTGL